MWDEMWIWISFYASADEYLVVPAALGDCYFPQCVLHTFVQNQSTVRMWIYLRECNSAPLAKGSCVLFCLVFKTVSGFSLHCPGPHYRAQCGGLNEKCPPRKLRCLNTSSPDDYAFGKVLRPVGQRFLEEESHWGGHWECITSPHFQFTLLASHASWRCDLLGSCSGPLLPYLPHH